MNFQICKRGLLEALVWFERFLAATKVRWQSCLWALKLMTSQTVQGRGSARRHHTVRHRPCWSLQYAERVSNMNLVYGLALHEFSVAQELKWIERAPSPLPRSLGIHRFKSPRGLRFFLYHTLVTCWWIHFHICLTELKIHHLSLFQCWELLANNIESVCTGLKWELVCGYFYLPSECTRR